MVLSLWQEKMHKSNKKNAEKSKKYAFLFGYMQIFV